MSETKSMTGEKEPGTVNPRTTRGDASSRSPRPGVPKRRRVPRRRPLLPRGTPAAPARHGGGSPSDSRHGSAGRGGPASPPTTAGRGLQPAARRESLRGPGLCGGATPGAPNRPSRRAAAGHSPRPRSAAGAWLRPAGPRAPPGCRSSTAGREAAWRAALGAMPRAHLPLPPEKCASKWFCRRGWPGCAWCIDSKCSAWFGFRIFFGF